MSHQITATDNMFSVREMPWHRLVEPLPDYPTRAEAQSIAHPWEPVETDVYRAVPIVTDDGPTMTYEAIPGSKGIARSDNGAHIGVVNSTLGLVTNDQMWDVAEAVGAETGDEVKYETAGSLDGGRRVWILMRLAEPLVIKGDPNGASLAYFALQNAHDGSGSFRGQGLNTRIVCANTSTAADVESKRTGYEFTFRHSSKVSSRIEEAKTAVRLWREQISTWQNAMEQLIGYRITDAQLETFVQEFHPMPPDRLITDRVRNNVDKARGELRAILAGPTSADVAHTAYGLAQAGIEWSQHYRRTTGSTDRVRMENHFRRAMLTTNKLGADTVTLARQVALSS